jgi:hypothetical protein
MLSRLRNKALSFLQRESSIPQKGSSRMNLQQLNPAAWAA